MDMMSFTELEHAASAPNRFVKSIEGLPQAAKPRQLLPHQKRVGDFGKLGDSVEAPNDVSYPGEIFLVPGGRFLVTASSHLCLWDLGYNSNVMVKALPVAAIELEGPAQTGGLIVAPSSCRKHLIVSVYTKSA